MAKINLRPWREELRQERQKEYVMALALVLVSALAVWWFVSGAIGGAVSDQQYRNAYLERQGASLDEQTKEIRELRSKREQLLDRMRLIQDLQGNRPVIVRVFDELARVMPEELFFTQVTAKGTSFTLKGKAASNEQISQLMRNFDESPWFINPNLLNVQSNKGGYSSFDMLVEQTRPVVGEAE
jgi:type IV pilus assembly protein PilN